MHTLLLPSALLTVQTLLITDSLFRTTDVKKRKKMVALVDEVTAGAPQDRSHSCFSAERVRGGRLWSLHSLQSLVDALTVMGV